MPKLASMDIHRLIILSKDMKRIEDKKKDIKKVVQQKRVTLILVIAIVLTIVSTIAVLAYKNSMNAYSGILQHAYTSVYEKLETGIDINVLVVGDSIGQGAGASDSKGWASLLPSAIEDKYGSKCNLTNVSMGGNTSYAGIVRIGTLDDGIDYDLVIVCFGENDDESELPSQYEGLIRAIQSKYGNSSIISILESSQRDYTNKIQSIISIADYYNIPIVDTIAAFNESGYSYDELVNAPDDMIHPNDIGHKIYLSTLMDVISDQVDSLSLSENESDEYDNMLYFDRKDMSISGIYRYKLTLDKPITAEIGIYRNYCSGENGVKVYIDGVLIYDANNIWNGAEQSHIHQIVKEPVYIENTVEIEFSSLDLAKRFYGIAFTNIQ